VSFGGPICLWCEAADLGFPMASLVYPSAYPRVGRIGESECWRGLWKIFRFRPSWEESRPPQGIISWANAAKSSLDPFSGGRAYLNYLTEDQGEPGVRAAFGGNYERLAGLKKKWDPTNFFNLNYNIKPAA
jgi:hypothetical protein